MNLASFYHSNRALILLSTIILAVPVLLYQTTLAMADVWWVNETFTHGFLVFPIVFWLIWEKKKQLSVLQPTPIPAVYIITLLSACLWLISALIDIKVVMQLSMIAIILTMALASMGWKIVEYLLFPMLFLFFAVPLGQGLIPPMMEFTAHNTVNMIKLTGIPIYQEGLTFVLPSGNWSVVEECSGVRYLIASLTLGVAYAYMTYASLKKRLIFIGFAIAVPLVANSLRAFMIVMLGHYSGMKLAVGADHLLYGWVLFGIIIFILFYVGSFWRDSKEDFEKLAPAADSHVDTRAGRYIALSLLIVMAFQLIHIALSPRDEQLTTPDELTLLSTLEIRDWKHVPAVEKKWQPMLHKPDMLISETYRKEEASVQLDIGYYHIQREDKEAVSSNNKLTNPYGGDWKIVSSGRHKVGLSTDTAPRSVRQTIVSRGGDKKLVWQWYRIGSNQTDSPYWAKLYEAYNLIFTERNDASYITLTTSIVDDQSTAESILHDNLMHSSDIIYHFIDQIYEAFERDNRS